MGGTGGGSFKYKSKKSCNNCVPLLSRFTQQFKLVQEIITHYHVVIIRLNIQQKHLDDILSTVALYLNRQSPKLLSTCAREFFAALEHFDGGAVYQKLQAVEG